MSSNDQDRVEVRSVSIYPIHWATVDAYAKDQGYGSTSAGLRRIVDEWLELKPAARTNAAALHDLQSRFDQLVGAVTQALDDDGNGYDARANLNSTLTRVTHQAPLIDPTELNQVPQFPGLRKGLK